MRQRRVSVGWADAHRSSHSHVSPSQSIADVAGEYLRLSTLVPLRIRRAPGVPTGHALSTGAAATVHRHAG